VWQVCCSASAVARETLATTLAEGCRSAISRARLGPVTTAIRSGSTAATSAITWLILKPVPSSIPFARLTTTASSGSGQSARLPRRDCDGTAMTTNSAPAIAAAGSLSARTDVGSSMVGK
jgi:hypothetical protein